MQARFASYFLSYVATASIIPFLHPLNRTDSKLFATLLAIKKVDV